MASKRRRRALICSRPRGRPIFQEMLQDSFDIVPVLTMDEAFQALKSEPRVDLILSTLAFDESRMIEFLQAVKRDPKLCDIPFYCCRVVSGVISDDLTADLAIVCKACEAENFADLAKLSRDAAAKALKAMLGA